MLVQFLGRQQRLGGAIPDDRTILIEAFRTRPASWAWPCSRRSAASCTSALKLALLARLRRRLGVTPACLHVDAGLLFRLPNLDEPPLDLFEGLTGALAEDLIREELPETALFGLRFRQNAARALLMPRPDPAKRTPLWLQRLRAKDLLQVARQFPDFPIVLETFRECLDEDLDLPRLRGFLDAVQAGSIRVVRRRGEIRLAVDLRADLRASPRRISTRGTSRRPATASRPRRSSMRTCSRRCSATEDRPIPPGSTPRRSGASTPACGDRPTRLGPRKRWPNTSACSAT